jgi:hypothetical protein
MSLYSYAWHGHILARESEIDGDATENVIPVGDDLFDQIAADFESVTLPDHIKMEELGRVGDGKIYFLAAGSEFCEGFRFYGGHLIFSWTMDDDYLAAMKSNYGLELPPSRIMFGVASDY